MSTITTEQALATREAVLDLAGQIFLVPASPQQGFPARLKRILDVIVSGTLIVLLLPLFAAIAVAIVVETGRPVFFRQKRLGLSGKSFTVYKFRSMVRDAEMLLPLIKDHNEIGDGPIFKWRRDPRITKVGSFLRRSSLDELPQLFNVLQGTMSLVGPRPPLESEVAKYEQWHVKRLSVKPGMTGLWQVSGRSNLSFPQMVSLDIEYVDEWSLLNDLKILARTPAAVLLARGAF